MELWLCFCYVVTITKNFLLKMTHQSFDAGVVYCYDAKELMVNRKITKSAMSDLRPASLVVSKESAKVEFDKTRQRPSDTLSSQFAFP